MPTAPWPLTAFLSELVFKLAVIALLLLRRRASSPTTLAWIVVIFALPLFGTLLYLLVGEARLGGARIARHLEIVKRIQSSLPFIAAASGAVRPKIAAEFQGLAILAEAVGDNDALGGNSLKLMGDTDLFIQSLVEDIDAAEYHCHLLFYIFLTDHSGQRIAKSLMRAAQRGVRCRLLVDAVGSKAFARSPLRKELERAGVVVVESLKVHPLRMLFARIDLRNHRKIAVIDAHIGYTGSQNIADAEFAIKPKFAPWVDAAVRVEGPVVWDLQMLFVEDWYLDTDESLLDTLNLQPLTNSDGVVAQIIGTGPNSYNEAMRQLMQSALHTAREELILTTPYFVPDDATISALCTAARRDVRTLLVLPARNDSPLIAAASRGHYQTLLDAGVEIHEYQKGLLHAKTMTIDRNLALIGTANLDRRSFELNFEVSLIVYNDDFAGQLRFLQMEYLSDSQRVDPAWWKSRGWPRRLWHNAAGTLSPLL